MSALFFVYGYSIEAAVALVQQSLRKNGILYGRGNAH